MAHQTETQSMGSVPGEAGFERARQTTERLRSEATGKVEQAGEQARRALDENKHRLADRLRRLGSSLHTASEQLPEEDRAMSGYADRLRDRIERAADYVDSTNVEATVRDIERFAQRQPALFFGGAFAAGLALARFLKSRGQGEFGMDTRERSYAEPQTAVEQSVSVFEVDVREPIGPVEPVSVSPTVNIPKREREP